MHRVRALLALAIVLAPRAVADETTAQKCAVCALHDVNHDGVSDVAVAGQERDAQEHVWIISGKDGVVLHTIRGTGDGLGGSMADAGDVDRDGADDLVVGAFARELPYTRNVAKSCVRVYSGATGKKLFEIHAGHFEESLGYCVAGVGDVDGDGTPDFAASSPIGAALHDLQHARGDLTIVDYDYRPGYVRIWSGRDGSLLYQIDGKRTGTGFGEAFGVSVCSVGDIDHDGRPDIAVSAPGAGARAPDEPHTRLTARPSGTEGWETSVGLSLDLEATGGCVRIFSGRFGTEIGSFARTTEHGAYGWTLAPAGDVDGDGRPDILVGTLHRNVDVVSGATLEVLHHETDDMYPFGDPYAFASSLGSIGDVDGDGRPDFVVGANEEWWAFDPGHVDLISGKKGTRIWRFFDVVTSPRATAFQWPRREPERTQEGYDACGCGDVDGDGVPDVAVVTQFSRELVFLSGKDGHVVRRLKIAGFEK